MTTSNNKENTNQKTTTDKVDPNKAINSYPLYTRKLFDFINQNSSNHSAASGYLQKFIEFSRELLKVRSYELKLIENPKELVTIFDDQAKMVEQLLKGLQNLQIPTQDFVDLATEFRAAKTDLQNKLDRSNSSADEKLAKLMNELLLKEQLYMALLNDHVGSDDAFNNLLNEMEQLQVRIIEINSRNDNKSYLEQESKLLNKVTKLGMKIHDVEHRGDCFFEAIADQLQQLHVSIPEPQPQVASVRDAKPHEKLRAIVAHHINKYKGEYKNFKVGNENNQNIAHPGVWADNIAILALARELKITICIIRSDDAKPTVIKGPKGAPVDLDRIVCLAYHVNFHYMSARSDSTKKSEAAVRAARAELQKHINSVQNDNWSPSVNITQPSRRATNQSLLSVCSSSLSLTTAQTAEPKSNAEAIVHAALFAMKQQGAKDSKESASNNNFKISGSSTTASSSHVATLAAPPLPQTSNNVNPNPTSPPVPASASNTNKKTTTDKVGPNKAINLYPLYTRKLVDLISQDSSNHSAASGYLQKFIEFSRELLKVRSYELKLIQNPNELITIFDDQAKMAEQLSQVLQKSQIPTQELVALATEFRAAKKNLQNKLGISKDSETGSSLFSLQNASGQKGSVPPPPPLNTVSRVGDGIATATGGRHVTTSVAPPLPKTSNNVNTNPPPPPVPTYIQRMTNIIDLSATATSQASSSHPVITTTSVSSSSVSAPPPSDIDSPSIAASSSTSSKTAVSASSHSEGKETKASSVAAPVPQRILSVAQKKIEELSGRPTSFYHTARRGVNLFKLADTKISQQQKIYALDYLLELLLINKIITIKITDTTFNTISKLLTESYSYAELAPIKDICPGMTDAMVDAILICQTTCNPILARAFSTYFNAQYAKQQLDSLNATFKNLSLQLDHVKEWDKCNLVSQDELSKSGLSQVALRKQKQESFLKRHPSFKLDTANYQVINQKYWEVSARITTLKDWEKAPILSWFKFAPTRLSKEQIDSLLSFLAESPGDQNKFIAVLNELGIILKENDESEVWLNLYCSSQHLQRLNPELDPMAGETKNIGLFDLFNIELFKKNRVHNASLFNGLTTILLLDHYARSIILAQAAEIKQEQERPLIFQVNNSSAWESVKTFVIKVNTLLKSFFLRPEFLLNYYQTIYNRYLSHKQPGGLFNNSYEFASESESKRAKDPLTQFFKNEINSPLFKELCTNLADDALETFIIWYMIVFKLAEAQIIALSHNSDLIKVARNAAISTVSKSNRLLDVLARRAVAPCYDQLINHAKIKINALVAEINGKCSYFVTAQNKSVQSQNITPAQFMEKFNQLVKLYGLLRKYYEVIISPIFFSGINVTIIPSTTGIAPVVAEVICIKDAVSRIDDKSSLSDAAQKAIAGFLLSSDLKRTIMTLDFAINGILSNIVMIFKHFDISAADFSSYFPMFKKNNEEHLGYIKSISDFLSQLQKDFENMKMSVEGFDLVGKPLLPPRPSIRYSAASSSAVASGVMSSSYSDVKLSAHQQPRLDQLHSPKHSKVFGRSDSSNNLVDLARHDATNTRGRTLERTGTPSARATSLPRLQNEEKAKGIRLIASNAASNAAVNISSSAATISALSPTVLPLPTRPSSVALNTSAQDPSQLSSPSLFPPATPRTMASVLANTQKREQKELDEIFSLIPSQQTVAKSITAASATSFSCSSSSSSVSS